MNKTLLKIFIIINLIAQVGAPTVFAIENTFKTSVVVVANDVANPTIPGNLVATAVSTSQIDLSWDASTDDLAVAGYRIFRDGFIIASTTFQTYSNTGLTVNTNYVYTVEAFDNVPKYSGESASATATTSAEVVVTPGTSGGAQGTDVLKITNLNVNSSQSSALVNFDTNQPTQTKVYWGTTKDYELGSISGFLYTYNHTIKIDNLDPAATYFYKVVATNSNGISIVTESTFKTQNIIQYTIPNVTNLKALVDKTNNIITLNWNNPKSFDFDSIRVVKSDKFYPRDPSEGEIVFEGKAQNYEDRNVEVGTNYYYTVFVKDNDGKYSSGALIQSRIAKPGEANATSSNPFGGVVMINNVHPDIAKLTLADFDFIQDGRKIVNIGNTIAIDGSKNLTIVLDYNKIPEILKTIAFTLSDPEDPTSMFTFLLRVNEEKTAYEATIAPLGKSGNYGLNVMVLDYKNQGLKRLEGSLRAFVFGSVEGILSNNTGTNYLFWIWLLILITLIYIISKISKVSFKEKDNLHSQSHEA